LKFAPPYYAVIFTSLQSSNTEGYAEMATAMERLAREQPGFIDFEHARETMAITVSYWESLEAIANWKSNLDHLSAQKLGKDQWYQWYRVRICRVERDYEFPRDSHGLE
jgi:heme-degrading monooxygenase HmoA